MAAQAFAAPSIKSIPRVFGPLSRFISENSGFESSLVVEAVEEAVGAQANINVASMVPVRHKVFSFEAAQKWGFFLFLALRRLQAPGPAEEGVAPLVLPPAVAQFDYPAYCVEIAKIYDIAAEGQVWGYLDEDEDEDEDEDGDDMGGV